MAEMDMDRIRDELAKEAGKRPALEAIGEYVTERVRKGAALPEGKTLTGAYLAIEAEARKRWQNGNSGSCVCIGPDQAMKIIDGFFGFQAEPQAIAPVHQEAAPDALDLDALLGGL